MTILEINNSSEEEDFLNLATNTDITACHWRGLEEDGIEQAIEALKSNTAVTTLSLDKVCEYTDEDYSKMSLIARFIRTNTSITKFIMNRCDINENAAEVLADALSENNVITHLDLSRNSISNDCIYEALKGNTRLNYLDLSYNKFNSDLDGRENLCSLIAEENNSIKVFNFSGYGSFNGMVFRGGGGESYDYKTNEFDYSVLDNEHCKVTHFYFNDNLVSSLNVDFFCCGLVRANNELSHLYIRNNELEDEGCTQFATALTHENNQLIELDISKNRIGSKGISAFAKAMNHGNFKIKMLDFSDNKFNEKSVQVFAQALGNNTTLRRLVFKDNEMSGEGAKAFAGALEINSSLISVNLSANDIGDDGANALLEALGKNKSITTFNMYCRDVILHKKNEFLERNKAFLKDAFIEAAKPSAVLTENQQKTLIAHIDEIEDFLIKNERLLRKKLVELIGEVAKYDPSAAGNQQRSLDKNFDKNYVSNYKKIIVENIKKSAFSDGINFFLKDKEVPAIYSMIPPDEARNFNEALKGSRVFRDLIALKREKREAEGSNFTKGIEQEREATKSLSQGK